MFYDGLLLAGNVLLWGFADGRQAGKQAPGNKSNSQKGQSGVARAMVVVSLDDAWEAIPGRATASSIDLQR
jgi:hypothetical protein